MTIGAVLAALAAVAATATTWAAMLLFLSLIAPKRAHLAQTALTTSPGPMALRGFIIALIVGFVALLLSQNASGIVKAFAILLLAGLGLLAAVGSAGIVRTISERIGEQGPQWPPFAALTRAAVLYVLAGFFPVAGWLLITPAALFLSIGAGATAMLPAKKPVVPTIAMPSPETALDARI